MAVVEDGQVQEPPGPGGISAHLGGGFFCGQDSVPVLTGCSIDGNRATYRGGGIYLWAGTRPIFRRCAISGNSSPRDRIAGGVFCGSASSPEFLFLGGSPPPCEDAADADDSGALDISDGILLFDWLFRGGQEPAAPFPDCGVDGGVGPGCGNFRPCR